MHALDRLAAVIQRRKSARTQDSYTNRLLARGLPKIAQKVGEEAAEVIVAALAQNRKALAEESVDLLYHLLVLWNKRGLPPPAVYAVLEKRLMAGKKKTEPGKSAQKKKTSKRKARSA